MSKSNLFSELPLTAGQQTNLKALGYITLTEIQQQSLPHSLNGKDLIAQAATGSGKTLAFGLPIVERVKPDRYHVQALVLCPTRELAGQVADEMRKLARSPGNIKILSLCGGQPMGPQIGSLEHGAHIIIGTPGRIVDHLRKRTLDISQVATLVLDEADRMLDMGFQDDLEKIIKATPGSRQTLLFSATYPENIEALSGQYQRNPVSVRGNSKNESVSTITHRAYRCDLVQQAEGTLAMLTQQKPESAIIFCNTRDACNELSKNLRRFGVQSGVLHGDMEQRDRDEVLIRFANGSLRFLIATDVAARGLDIENIELVINASLPRDPAVYVHRCGRTGRAGRKGMAISLVGGKDDRWLEKINEESGLQIQAKPLPKAQINQIEKLQSSVRTLQLSVGRKNKIRPGDIVGALTATQEIKGDQIGAIQILDFASFVAIPLPLADRAMNILRSRPIKGKSARVRKI